VAYSTLWCGGVFTRRGWAKRFSEAPFAGGASRKDEQTTACVPSDQKIPATRRSHAKDGQRGWAEVGTHVATLRAFCSCQAWVCAWCLRGRLNGLVDKNARHGALGCASCSSARGRADVAGQSLGWRNPGVKWVRAHVPVVARRVILSLRGMVSGYFHC